MKFPIAALFLAGLVVGGLAVGCVGKSEKPTGEGGKSKAPPTTEKGKSDASPSSATSKPTKDPKKGATEKPDSRPAEKVGAADRLDEGVYDHFGDGVKKGVEPLALANVAVDAKKYDGKKIRLTGKIQSVCKKKGCWMVLADGPHKVRVKFRDYEFFVPTDSDGRTAILDGKFAVKETSVADLKHYLEDAGKHAEAKKVTEPKRELTVMADGVALRKGS